MPLKHADMVAVVHGYMDALNRSDLDAIVALYAADGSVEDPVGTQPLVGAEAIRAFYARSTAQPLRVQLQGDIRAVANEVVFAFSVEIPTAQGPLVISPIDHFRLNEQGRITHMRAFFSTENFAQPAAKSAQADAAAA